jgi:hypothetical protein
MTMEPSPPRTREERLADARAMLAGEADCWVATAADGLPHLVPLSFIWHDGVVLLATPRRYRTVRNAASHPEVRLAVGTTGDVVILEGTAVVRDLDEVAGGVLDSFAGKAGWDPRHSAGNVAIEVTPQRVLTWRHENELDGRVLMRDGVWLDEEERS